MTAQSYWLRKRALYLQDQCATEPELTPAEQGKQLALFIRYQTTHERAFHCALNHALKLRPEGRKAEIAFESHRREEAAKSRRQSAEKRKQDLHQWAVLLAEAKLNHQQVVTSNPELDAILAGAAPNHCQDMKTSGQVFDAIARDQNKAA